MKKLVAIDIVILAAAPMLAAIIATVEVATGFMPNVFSVDFVVFCAFAPVLWFVYAGTEALILWILPFLFLILMAVSLYKRWKKWNITFAILFTLCWLGITQFLIFLDALGGC